MFCGSYTYTYTLRTSCSSSWSIFYLQVYDTIASHFSGTRHTQWPKVAEFLSTIPVGSLMADIGCGNGKYLSANPSQPLFKVHRLYFYLVVINVEYVGTQINCMLNFFRSCRFFLGGDYPVQYFWRLCLTNSSRFWAD